MWGLVPAELPRLAAFSGVFPAKALGTDVLDLLGNPGMIEGCAQGDVPRREDDGRFQAEQRCHNLCAHATLGHQSPH